MSQLKTRDEIKAWLDGVLSLSFYTIHEDLTVDVRGDVLIPKMRLTEIPVQFGTVSGYFDCSGNLLQTLKGSPISVGKTFNCCQNELVSLEYSPQSVGESFFCEGNKLSTLKGCPEFVGQHFSCSLNKLTSLEYSPKSVGMGFYCLNNNIKNLIGFNCTGGQYFYHKGKPIQYLESLYKGNTLEITFQVISSYLLKQDLDNCLSVKINKTKKIKL